MSQDRQWWEEPHLIYPAGLIALVVVIFLMAKVLIPAIGIAIGLAITIAAAGLGGAVAGGVVSYWLVTAVAAGIAVSGFTISLRILVNVSKQAKDDLYSWALPVLSVVAAFIVDVCKVFTPWQIGDVEFGRAIFGALTAVLFLIGGLLWKRGTLFRRFVAIVFFLISPIWICAAAALQHPNRNLIVALRDLDSGTQAAIIGLIIVFLLTIALAFELRDGSKV